MLFSRLSVSARVCTVPWLKANYQCHGGHSRRYVRSTCFGIPAGAFLANFLAYVYVIGNIVIMTASYCRTHCATCANIGQSQTCTDYSW
jgi:hypothetical protein